MIYDVSPALRLLRELRGRGVGLPVIAAFAPFGDPKAITRLIHEVPWGCAGRRWRTAREPATTRSLPTLLSAVLYGVTRLDDLINGVLIHPPRRPDDRMTGLIAGLARMRRAS